MFDYFFLELNDGDIPTEFPQTIETFIYLIYLYFLCHTVVIYQSHNYY